MNEIIGVLSFGTEGWGDELLQGAWLTIQLAVCAMLLGLVLGTLLAAGKLSGFKPLSWLCNGYTLLLRGIPEFLVILYVYFSADSIINAVLGYLVTDTEYQLPKFLAAVIGLGMVFAVYACEIVRGAFLAVPLGQIESANAIGMSHIQVLTRITFPQMIRFSIPALGNLWLIVLKDTSLAAVIALDELLRISKVAGETESAQLTFLLCAAAIYLLVTMISDVVRSIFERRAMRGVVGI